MSETELKLEITELKKRIASLEGQVSVLIMASAQIIAQQPNADKLTADVTGYDAEIEGAFIQGVEGDDETRDFRREIEAKANGANYVYKTLRSLITGIRSS